MENTRKIVVECDMPFTRAESDIHKQNYILKLRANKSWTLGKISGNNNNKSSRMKIIQETT